jgi:hypothetical protein
MGITSKNITMILVNFLRGELIGHTAILFLVMGGGVINFIWDNYYLMNFLFCLKS